MNTTIPMERARFPSPRTDGAEIGGELYAPSDARTAAVLLIPDVHGISPLYRSLGERLAAEGFRTLVMDLYAREGAPRLRDLSEITAWIDRLPDARVLGDLAAARNFLARRDDVRPEAIGILGFCLGGQYALMASCGDPGLAACVSFYGMLRYPNTNERKPESPLAMAPRLGCPYLGLFGEDDALIPPADVSELEEILRRHDKTFDVVRYPGAGHAFLNEARLEAYRPEAARDAWHRAVSFLHRRLGDKPG